MTEMTDVTPVSHCHTDQNKDLPLRGSYQLPAAFLVICICTGSEYEAFESSFGKDSIGKKNPAKYIFSLLALRGLISRGIWRWRWWWRGWGM